jgi:DNA-binding NarL/FixJ family response regulator
LAEGKANKEIALKLGITIKTTETHRAKIMLKLGLHSLTELSSLCDPSQNLHSAKRTD